MDKAFYQQIALTEALIIPLVIAFYLFFSRKKSALGLKDRRFFLLPAAIALVLLIINYSFLFGRLHNHNTTVFIFYGLPWLALVFWLSMWILPKFLRINLVVFLVFLMLAEAVFFLIGRSGKPDIRSRWLPDKPGLTEIIQSKVTGYMPRPSNSGRKVKLIEGDTVYDARYSFDAYSRRVLPGFSDSTTKFLLFFGGSRTFGEGVSDDECIPYYVSRDLGNPHVYSYSFSGWGPAQMLALLRERDLSQEVSGDSGTAVLFMFGGHVRRTVGSWKIATKYNGGGIPFFYRDKDGGFVRKRMFVNGRPVKAVIFSLLSFSPMFNFFVHDFPLKPEDYAFTAELLQEIRSEMQDQIGVSRFVVFLHPGDPEVQPIKPYLEAKGIEFLDLDGVIPFSFTEETPFVHHRLDPHFRPEGNERLAKAMAEYLR
jgi:hypothetical protein